MKSYKYIIRGRVQGVGFRYFVYRHAVSLGISGSVKNRLDGAVEIVAQGDEESMNIFENYINQGPPASRVDKVIKEEINIDPIKGFQIVG